MHAFIFSFRRFYLYWLHNLGNYAQCNFFEYIAVNTGVKSTCQHSAIVCILLTNPKLFLKVKIHRNTTNALKIPIKIENAFMLKRHFKNLGLDSKIVLRNTIQ
jgi:hypothetical protein